MDDVRIAGVIVAAGRSLRLGQPKALIEIDGQPILTRLLDVFVAAGLAPVIAVISEETRHAVPDSAIAVDGDPHSEMIDSVIRGIEAIPGDVHGVVVQPVDAPFTSEEMIARLVEDADDRLRALVHQGQSGHPVFIPRSAFDAVRARPDGGLRSLFIDGMESIEWHTPKILADLDSPDDLRQWHVPSSR